MKENVMGEDFIREWKDTARYLEENQVYSPEQEHSSCGVGLVAAIDAALGS